MSVKLPKDIIQPLTIPFSVLNFGLHVIKIVARCKVGQDLRVEIDSIKLREVPAKDKPQYNNIPPAWNGSELKGLDKTVFYILPLNKGDHILKCIPSEGSVIIFFDVNPINDLREIVFGLNLKAEEGDRRPWCTFAFINLPLLSLGADVSVAWHLFDGDDIKLIIDNEIKKNAGSKFWKHWIWSARPWNILSKPHREIKEFATDLAQGMHYIELWADKTPILHSVSFDLGNFKLVRIPDEFDPEWTGDFNDDTDEMLLARLIYGESENQSREAKIWTGGAVLNRVKAPAWPDTIHGVILQKGQYDPFKLKDQNYEKIKNPLQTTDALKISSWVESFHIARGLISGELNNPTTATHFHGVGVTKEWFIEHVVPEGKFLKRIDDTYFYWSPN